MKTHFEHGDKPADGWTGVDVPPISLLIQRGQYGKPTIAGPGGALLACGDRWPLPTEPNSMDAHVEVYNGELHVALTLRFDDYDDIDWQAFAGIPAIVSLLATPPINWFVMEIAGLHCRSPVAIHRDPLQADLIRRLANDPNGTRTITLFGISHDTVRAIKVGIHLDQIWKMLAHGMAEVKATPSARECINVLEKFADVPASVMFAEAIRRHVIGPLQGEP